MAQKNDKFNIFSILAIIFAFLFYPAGLAFAIIALVQIEKSGERGKGLAIAAIVIPLILGLLALMLLLYVFSRASIQ